jgi:hypothetical protein
MGSKAQLQLLVIPIYILGCSRSCLASHKETQNDNPFGQNLFKLKNKYFVNIMYFEIVKYSKKLIIIK